MGVKVLQMGPYPPPYGGVQINLVALRQFLLSRHIPCSVINLTRFRGESADSIYFPSGVLQVLWLLARLKYNIVHLQVGGDLSVRIFLLCLFCSLIPRSRTVLTFHSGGYSSTEKGKSASPWTFRGAILRRLDRIIAVNDDIREVFIRFGVDKSRIHVIRPDAVTFQPPAESMPEFLQRVFHLHKPVLVSVGGLEPEYQIPIQIEALGFVRRKFPRAGLVVIGSGSLENTIREAMVSKPYAEHILLCNDVSHPITLRAIADSDVFLRTTLYDGDSISVREALFFGVPVIATDNHMRPESVILVPVSDVNALCEAIERACSGGVPAVRHGAIGDQSLEAVLSLYRGMAEEIESEKRM